MRNAILKNYLFVYKTGKNDKMGATIEKLTLNGASRFEKSYEMLLRNEGCIIYMKLFHFYPQFRRNNANKQLITMDIKLSSIQYFSGHLGSQHLNKSQGLERQRSEPNFE